MALGIIIRHKGRLLNSALSTKLHKRLGKWNRTMSQRNTADWATKARNPHRNWSLAYFDAFAKLKYYSCRTHSQILSVRLTLRVWKWTHLNAPRVKGTLCSLQRIQTRHRIIFGWDWHCKNNTTVLWSFCSCLGISSPSNWLSEKKKKRKALGWPKFDSEPKCPLLWVWQKLMHCQSLPAGGNDAKFLSHVTLKATKWFSEVILFCVCAGPVSKQTKPLLPDPDRILYRNNVA